MAIQRKSVPNEEFKSAFGEFFDAEGNPNVEMIHEMFDRFFFDFPTSYKSVVFNQLNEYPLAEMIKPGFDLPMHMGQGGVTAKSIRVSCTYDRDKSGKSKGGPPLMPKKSAKKTEPFVPADLAPVIFKAFSSADQSADMIVDISGDTFSHSISAAIIAYYDTLPQAEIMKIPTKRVLVKDEEVECPEETTEPWMDHLIILALRMHDNTEFQNASADAGELDFSLRLKDCPSGYTSGVREYIIKASTFVMENTASKPLLSAMDLVCEDPDKEDTDLFPKTISIRRNSPKMG